MGIVISVIFFLVIQDFVWRDCGDPIEFYFL